jgi:predicted metal-dependent hydrolase
VCLLNAFSFFFIQVDLLNSLCSYVHFHQNDNSSNNKKDPRWRCRWKEGREGELKYEMHLALAQYNGPAFSPLPLVVVKQLFYRRQVAGILIVSHRIID